MGQNAQVSEVGSTASRAARARVGAVHSNHSDSGGTAVAALGAGHDVHPDGRTQDGAGWPGPSWAQLHPVAAELEAMDPGPGLARRVTELVPADLDDAAVVEAVAAFERLASWAAAGQAAMIGELFRRRFGPSRDFVADEVAARLRTTIPVAEAKVGLAVGLHGLPAVADALAAGVVDVRRASVICDETAHLPEHVARDVAAQVLPAAADCTAPQLRAKVRRLECLRDPDGATSRHRRARGHRRVELVPAADAMAWINAYLPAPEAVAVHTALTALAQPVPLDEQTGDMDTRTLDQRRADALVDLTTRWLDAGTRPDGTPLPTNHRRHPHLHVTATAETILGLSAAPAVLDGYGVIPDTLARQIATQATWQPLLVAATSGEPLARSTQSYTPTLALRDAVITRDRTCTFPGCRQPAHRCDLDHVDPWDPTRTDHDQTTVDNLHALCRHHHRAKTHARWDPVRHPDGTTTWAAPTGHTYVRRPDHPPPHEPPPAPVAGAWIQDGRDAQDSGEGCDGRNGPTGDEHVPF